MSRSLPERPSLEQLRKQAKDLLKAQRQGDASVCPVLRHLPRFAGASDEDVLKAGLVALGGATCAGPGVRLQELGGVDASRQEGAGRR